MSARNILEQELEAANAVAPDYDLSKGFDSLGITEEDLTNRINPTTNAYARDENPFTARSRFGRISSVPYGYEPSEGKKVEQKFDPSSITPEEIQSNLKNMLIVASGGKGSFGYKQLLDTANNRPEEYKRVRRQILHDSLVKNPKLLQYYQDYLPEKLEEYDKMFQESNVVVAKTEWGTPVYAGSAYRVARKDQEEGVSQSTSTYDGKKVKSEQVVGGGYYGLPDSKKYGLVPLSSFDREKINTIVSRMETSTRVKRAVYESATVASSWTADFVMSGREKLTDLFHHNSDDWGVKPRDVAEFINNTNRQLKRPFVKNGGVKIFSDADLNNPKLTFKDVFGSTGAETFTDSLVGNFFARGEERYVESDRRLFIEGQVPFGKDFREQLLGTAVDVAVGRGIIEVGKAAVRGGFFAVRKGLEVAGKPRVDQQAIRKGIQTQINSHGSVWKRIGGARYNALLATNNLGRTLYYEELLGLTAVSSVAGLDAIGAFDFIDDGVVKVGLQVGAGLFAPIILAASPRLIMDPFSTSKDVLDSLFNGRALAIADGEIPLSKANRIERQLGTLLQDLKRNEPDVFNELFEPLIQFRKARTIIKDSFIKKGVPEQEIDDILKDLDTVHSSTFSLSIFASAKLVLGDPNVGMGIAKSPKLNKILRSMNVETRIAKNETEAMDAFGTALARLTQKTRELEAKGIGTSGELKEKIAKMQDHFKENILVKDDIKEEVSTALINIYGIRDRYENAIINKKSTKEELNTLLNTLETKEYTEGVRSAVYNSLIDMQINGKGTKWETILNSNKVITNYINTEISRVIEVNEIVENAGLISSRKLQDGEVVPKGDMPNYLPVAGAGAFGSFDSAKALRKEQRRLLSAAEDYHRTVASGKYTTALKGAEGDLEVDLGQFVLDVKNMEGGTYGFLADKQVASLLSKIVANRKKTLDEEGVSTKYQEELSDLFDDVASGKRDSFSEEEAAEILERLSKDFEDLTLREAIQFRSDIGKIAFNAKDRKAGVLLREVYSKFDNQIENSIPLEVSDLLGEAHTYYKSNVADTFYDPYIKRALNSEVSNDAPFMWAFGGTSTPDELSRRDLFDRMFAGTGEENAAYRAMQSAMIARANPKGQALPQKFVQNIRDEVSTGNAVFEDFLDVLLRNKETGMPDSTAAAKFRQQNRTAPRTKQKPDGDSVLDLESSNLAVPQSELRDRLLDDPFYAQNVDDQAKIIGDAAERISIAAVTAQRQNLSTTHGVWSSIGSAGDKSGNVGKALVKVILDAEDVDAVNIYNSILSDAKTALSDTEYNAFESSLRSLLAEEQFNATATRSIRSTSDDEPVLSSVDFTKFRKELEKRQGLWKAIYKDEFDPIVAITDLQTLAARGMTKEQLFTFGKSLNSMSETQALSRAWGVARGVVSVRYVATEFLLRQMAKGKADTLLKILSQEGLSQRLYDGVQRSAYPKYTKRGYSQSIIPILAGALSPSTDDESYRKTLAALFDIQEYARQEDISFEHVIFSLYLMSNSEAEMKVALEVSETRTKNLSIKQATQMSPASRATNKISVPATQQEQFNKMLEAQRQRVEAIEQKRAIEAQQPEQEQTPRPNTVSR
tara:strand:- start:45 stop:4814 length:4770 start_codon:yes stop_codon:yes gene_type:complete